MTVSGAIAATLVPKRRAAPKLGDFAQPGIIPLRHIIPPRHVGVRDIPVRRAIDCHAGPAASPSPPMA
jgi:hypothetical protein